MLVNLSNICLLENTYKKTYLFYTKRNTEFEINQIITTNVCMKYVYIFTYFMNREIFAKNLKTFN